MVLIGEALSKEEYDRSSVQMMRITVDVAVAIKAELNEFKKNEMVVHSASTQNTHFFK